MTPEHFTYDRWRHGGWYVAEVRYPSGACGCVSRQLTQPEPPYERDGRWRIVCDGRADDFVYPNRDAAARAEWHLAEAAKLAVNAI